MHCVLSLTLLWLLPLESILEEHSPLDVVPRKIVPYDRDNVILFSEEGVRNYSTMLLREDLGLLILGAREAIYALDLNDISKKKAVETWKVTDKQAEECEHKGKDPEIECKNYIRILHTLKDGRMYICGTNAFDPECDYMSYSDGKLTLENKAEDGKGKCPFDPAQRYSSIMVDEDLYSATMMNFLGSEPVVMRSSQVSVRTEFKSSWLQEPNFISMAQLPESQGSAEGDDDKIYLFFSEIAVEYDFYHKLFVSRVARVCKGDLGGQRTLQKKWTSFLKARVECPVLGSQLPYIIQDSYLWCDPLKDWKGCLFFAVFTPQSDTSDLSAVCAYNVADISRVFSVGKYKSPVTVATSYVKWVMYTGDVPSPRPGSCIDNEARNHGITQTLDLPDQTLQFIKDRPLMDHVIQPIGDKPLLVRRGSAFTRIVANQVQAADGLKHHVMFIGTEDGTMVKAVNYDGEMFIIEEVRLFQGSEPNQNPIKVLRFSEAKGQLYAGSDSGAVQMPLASCQRSLTCVDCVLARDPYCGWDTAIAKCTALSETDRPLIQSVKQGNASLCPQSGSVKPANRTAWLGGNVKLQCQPSSNLAETSWERDGNPMPSSTRLQHLRDGLLIFNATLADSGHYHCLSKERSLTDQYTTTVAEYRLSISPGTDMGVGLPTAPQARTGGLSIAGLQAAVGLLVVLLAALLGWNFYKGHLPLPWRCGQSKGAGPEPSPEVSVQGASHSSAAAQREALAPGSAESKPLVSEAGNGSNSNNNHASGEIVCRPVNISENVANPSLQFIDDESEI